MRAIEKIAKKVTICGIKGIIGNIAKTLYYFAPLCKPRNADVILERLYNDLTKISKNAGADFLYLEDNENGLLGICNTVLDIINQYPEFRDLNLSQNEIDAGISVDDPSRPKFTFTSAYDVYPEDYWKDDFIDLAAFGNMFTNYMMWEMCIIEYDSCSTTINDGCIIRGSRCASCIRGIHEILFHDDLLDDYFTTWEMKYCKDDADATCVPLEIDPPTDDVPEFPHGNIV